MTPEQGAVARADTLATLIDLMRRGRTAAAEAEIAVLASQDGVGDREEILSSLVAEPELHGALVALERWLDGTVDAPSAVGLSAWWALPSSGLDLPTITADARLYIDAYPKEGFVIGDVEERTADWLVRRIALTFDPGPRLPVMREAVTMLSGAARPDFPAVGTSLAAVVTEVDDATLWQSLVRQIAHSEMQRTPHAARTTRAH